MVQRGKRLRRVERQGFPVMDPRQTCVSHASVATALIHAPYHSGFRENYSDVPGV